MNRESLVIWTVDKQIQQISKQVYQCKNPVHHGIHVRTGLHASAWWCNSCVGKTQGSQVLQPDCGYCQIS